MCDCRLFSEFLITLLGVRGPVRLQRGVGVTEFESMRQESAGANALRSHKRSRSTWSPAFKKALCVVDTYAFGAV
jgi:hypothetical protein